MSRRRDLVVEFVGLPASGKTTLARAVEDRLHRDSDGEFQNEGRRVTTSSGQRSTSTDAATAAAMVASESIRAPLRSMRYLRGVYASRQKSLEKIPSYVGYQLYLWGELRRLTDGRGVHLSDQGFLQHLWRIHLTATADDTGYLRRLAALHYESFPTDVVVFVDVDHETRMNRGVERGTDVDEELFDPEHPAIQADLRTYRDIKDLVPDLGSAHEMDLRVLSVDNDDGRLEENVETIHECVLDEYRRRNRASPPPSDSRTDS